MSDTNLFWLDLEMTGLDPRNHHIIEAAAIVTDKNLRVVAQQPALVIHQSVEHLKTMNAEVRAMHTDSGLLNRVAASTTSLALAERLLIEFFQDNCIESVTLLCGNSIWVDRSFLKMHMPLFEKLFHYRMIDVTTIKELVKRWYPDYTEFKKEKRHTALADIQESIAELAYYKETYFKKPF